MFKLFIKSDFLFLKGTGKTSLIQRYTSGEFDKGYKATIGVDFCLKELEFDKTKMVSLQLWDIAGQERFANLTRVKNQMKSLLKKKIKH